MGMGVPAANLIVSCLQSLSLPNGMSPIGERWLEVQHGLGCCCQPKAPGQCHAELIITITAISVMP